MKISARDIQVFVAGALALLGIRALLYLPYYLAAPVHSFAWVGHLFGSCSAGLDLPIGLAILFGRRWGILLAQIYLWLSLVLGIINGFYFGMVLGSSKALSYISTISPDLIIQVALLWLIWLSQSKKFRHEPDA